MRKFFSISFIATSFLITNAFAADEKPWVGKLYDIRPNRMGISQEYCLAHAPDKYMTTATAVNKEIKAENGVVAKDLGYRIRGVGGIYFLDGTAEFSGTYEGEPWKAKVHYYANTLQREKGTQQGIWFSKDCKGFYQVGPE